MVAGKAHRFPINDLSITLTTLSGSGKTQATSKRPDSL